MKLIPKRLRSLDPGFYLYYVNTLHTAEKYMYLFESSDEHLYLFNHIKSERGHNRTFRVECISEERNVHKRSLTYCPGSLIFKLTKEEFLLETSVFI